jgi:hypothetical protein
MVAIADDRLVVDACILVCPEELRQDVEVGPDIVLFSLLLLVDPDQDPFSVDKLDDTGPLADEDIA